MNSLFLSLSLAQALVCGVRGVGKKEEEEKEEGEKEGNKVGSSRESG